MHGVVGKREKANYKIVVIRLDSNQALAALRQANDVWSHPCVIRIVVHMRELGRKPCPLHERFDDKPYVPLIRGHYRNR